jgi:hypothetical protein
MAGFRDTALVRDSARFRARAMTSIFILGVGLGSGLGLVLLSGLRNGLGLGKG